MRRLLLLPLLLLGLPLALPAAEQAPSPSLGRVDFPTTASPEAQAHFLRGVAALHSFWYDEAADAFQAAQKAEPGFALAYWGEALTYDHPIWGEQDLEAARQVLQRLAPTAAERAARAGNDKERAWLATVEALYGEGEKSERTRAYSEALQKVHERWPDDLEAASFYALSLIGPALYGGGALGEPRDRLLIRAAAILEEEVDRNPEHPGVLHYLIHAYDDPTHAPLGLRAARTYARVAPAAHHALHMPSHIFVQLGQWDRVAASNEDAWAASVAWTERRGLAVEKRDFHSLSWLSYAYLQQGRYGKAREVLEIARREARAAGGSRVEGSLALIEARHLIETRAWDEAKLPPGEPPPAEGGETDKAHAGHATGNAGWALTFAAGLAAGRRGDAATAEEALARLRDMPPGAYANVASILEKEVEGLFRLARGQEEEGLRLLGEAAEAEEALMPPSGPPDLLKPALELHGEVLLERGRTEEALKQLERSLLRMPNRTASLIGAARAASKLGRDEEARRYASALEEIWKQADPGVKEAAEIRVGR